MDRWDTSFEVLGGLRIRLPDRVLEMSRPVAAAALGALLLTPGQPVSAERLTNLVWGPAGSSRGALHMTVSRLRRWLADSIGLNNAVINAGTGYLVNVPAETVDACRFAALADAGLCEPEPYERLEVLRSALDLWHGPVLGQRSGSFYDDPVVLHLERTRVDCAHQLADLALELGRPGAALAPIQEIATELPYDETIHARLITLLGAGGRRAAGLRVYERVRTRLADELGVDPSAALRDAHADLLRDEDRPHPRPLPRPLGRPGADGRAVRPPRPPSRGAPANAPPEVPTPGIVCQLPADVRDFTGRAPELRSLRRGLRPGNGTAPAVWAVVGRGGVGKSAMAVRAAHELRKVFHDGQLYADLGGLNTQPALPAEVLTRFLRALGVEECHIPERPEARAEMYRARLADRRILVVLDDAAGQAQVTPLLPGSPTCGVIITSRARLSGLAGVHHITVPDLDDDRALELLSRIVGPDRVAGEPQAARELVHLCERLPLAIRIAAARLADRPHLRVARLAECMADPAHRLRELEYGQLSVRDSLALSYRGLAEPATRLFRRLGRLAASDIPDVPVRLGALLLEDTGCEAHEAFEQLVDAYLLDTVTDAPANSPRYRLRDLARLYARERAAVEEQQRDLVAIMARAEKAMASHRD